MAIPNCFEMISGSAEVLSRKQIAIRIIGRDPTGMGPQEVEGGGRHVRRTQGHIRNDVVVFVGRP